ncbi:MAG: putative manganese-dependent inorganic diphosphatase [Erysipelotrichaceae bacterium]|nr:putative manganese-dependent inorganic diphosphatase [Erysipelotrichaceae bacterium]
MTKPVYVTGHRNPDTDSIVSAIAYSEYKKAKGIAAVAGRIGPVSADTEYLLERFGFEDPEHLYSAKSTIAEIDYDKAVLIDPSFTIKEALTEIIDTDTRTLFVCDGGAKLLGLLSLSNLNNLWTADERYLSKLLKTATLSNIIKILKGKLLVKAEKFTLNGRVELSPNDEEVINRNDIIITSSRRRFKQALKAHAGLIIIIGHYDEFDDLLEEALREDINVMSTRLSAMKVSKLIYQTPTVDKIMIDAKDIVKVAVNETVDAALNKVSKSRYRSYPIIDENGVVIGALSRYHLLNYKKKQFILVDHNEVKQSIEDVESAEVIEIVDHHRYGGFITSSPIVITTMVVGATATIIANRYFEDKMKLSANMAGLLLGAILSDTMNFMSPTTTELDIQTAKKLEKLSGVNSDELYGEIIRHGESLSSRKSIDILYDDYKNYDINGIKVGISQAACKDEEEYKAVKEQLTAAMEEACKSRGLDIMMCMLTDPTGSGSYLLSCGDRQEVIYEMYPGRRDDEFVKKLMSRKKQLLPELIRALS